MKTLDNRRKCKRFRVPVDMEFVSLKKAADEYSFGKTRDFSCSGLSFASNIIDCELEDIIMIKFELLNKDNTYIYALADVKWKRRFANKCMVGVKIRRIDQESRSKKLDFPFNIWLNNFDT